MEKYEEGAEQQDTGSEGVQENKRREEIKKRGSPDEEMGSFPSFLDSDSRGTRRRQQLLRSNPMVHFLP